MNILFHSCKTARSTRDHGIFPAAVRELVRRGHHVYTVCAVERRDKRPTELIKESGLAEFLCIRTLNNQKVSLIEKALAVMSTPWLMQRNIRKYFKGVHFDLIIYTTPPVTIANFIYKLKKRLGASTYLMLKDIWPQVGVDLGALREGGLAQRYLRHKEKKLYRISDYIGCMSQGNIDYLKKYDPEIPAEKLEVCPNSLLPLPLEPIGAQKRAQIRAGYGIPAGALLCVYGGNLGAPQGVDFIMEILDHYRGDGRVYFMLVGNGTEYNRLDSWFRGADIKNAQVAPFMAPETYMELLRATDVGMVFLNAKLTIPNIPSRTLDYMQVGVPVLAAIDPATDMGDIMREGGFGLSSISGDMPAFAKNVETLLDDSARRRMGKNSREYFEANWTSAHTVDVILSHFDNNEQ